MVILFPWKPVRRSDFVVTVLWNATALLRWNEHYAIETGTGNAIEHNNGSIIAGARRRWKMANRVKKWEQEKVIKTVIFAMIYIALASWSLFCWCAIVIIFKWIFIDG